jgi:hypothetical protein
MESLAHIPVSDCLRWDQWVEPVVGIREHLVNAVVIPGVFVSPWVQLAQLVDHKDFLLGRILDVVAIIGNVYIGSTVI